MRAQPPNFSMKRIKKAKITFISLCPRGKNQMPVLYKADGTVEFDTVISASDDAGELTAIVYPSERLDSDKHLAGAETIREMAHAFQKDGGQIDIRHNGKAVSKDAAYVAESFIVQKGDRRFADMKDYSGAPVDATDAWAVVIKIDDPELRRLYREGEWNGVSMAGTALMETAKEDEAAPSWFTRAIAALFKTHRQDTANTDEIEMDKQELIDALAANNTSLVEALSKALKPETESEPESEPESESVVKSEGLEFDPTDKKAVEAHLASIKKAQLEKSIDWTDAEAVAKYLETMETPEGEVVTKDDEVSDEVKELRAKLAKAEGKSKQPAKGADESNDDFIGMTKEQVDQIKIGREIAEIANKNRGFVKN